MAIVMVCNDVTLLGELWDVVIVRVRKDVTLLGKNVGTWLYWGYVKMSHY